MAKTVTVRFYQIGKAHEAGIGLKAALEAIYALGPPGVRERQLSGSFRCRLERLLTPDGFVAGEMTRVRDDDYPSEVHPHGTSGLTVDVPIGDGIAFCFREADHRLAIEYDPRTLSPGRMIDYISAMNPAALFDLHPSIDAMALARFRAQPLRKVSFRVAGINNLPAVENVVQPVATALVDLSHQYNAPMVSIEMSMGNARGELAEGAKQMVEGILQMIGHGADVRSLHVTPDAGEGVQNEDINLIDTLLSVKSDLVLPNKMPDESYDLRAANLREKLAVHV